MYTKKDNKQQYLFDPWDSIGPRRRKLLDSGWPGFFRNEILPILPVEVLASSFHQTMGRPSKDLYSVVGLLIFQQMFDKTDDEAVDSFSFDVRFHYALNITGESDSEKYISPKTLWNFRQLLIDHGLEELVFDTILDTLKALFDVDTSLQRIDSVHVKSNMKKLGRITIFTQSNIKFLTNVKRQDGTLYSQIDPELRDRYMKKGVASAFSLVKPSEAAKTLTQVASDLYTLVELFKGVPAVCNMTSYKLMVRVLEEQCTITPTEGSSEEFTVEPKPSKEISSGSLQNPSDPDAAYSGHKGQGYQAQIMETYTCEEDPSKKKEILNLITHVEVEPANQSDSDALVPALKQAKQRDFLPEKVLADTLYGGDDNVMEAESLGVELIAPVPGTGKASKLGEFIFHDNGFIQACPKGFAPSMTKKNKASFTCGFDKATCKACDRLKGCPAEPRKKYYHVRYTDKDLRITERKAYEKTDPFTKQYTMRAGVEATMSQLDRKTGAKHLRVRGLAAVRFAIFLKVAGINLLRAMTARKARNRRLEGNLDAIFGPIIGLFQCQSLIWQGARRFFQKWPGHRSFETKWALFAV